MRSTMPPRIFRFGSRPFVATVWHTADLLGRLASGPYKSHLYEWLLICSCGGYRAAPTNLFFSRNHKIGPKNSKKNLMQGGHHRSATRRHREYWCLFELSLFLGLGSRVPKVLMFGEVPALSELRKIVKTSDVTCTNLVVPKSGPN